MQPEIDAAVAAGGTWIVAVYLVYLATSVALTVWVARTLHRNGRPFLFDTFHGNADLADSVNHLLVVGFYLVNAGFVAMALKTTAEVGDARVAIELLSQKLGMVLLVLGGMHFLNIAIFNKFRKRALVGAPGTAGMGAAPLAGLPPMSR